MVGLYFTWVLLKLGFYWNTCALTLWHFQVIFYYIAFLFRPLDHPLQITKVCSSPMQPLTVTLWHYVWIKWAQFSIQSSYTLITVGKAMKQEETIGRGHGENPSSEQNQRSWSYLLHHCAGSVCYCTIFLSCALLNKTNLKN